MDMLMILHVRRNPSSRDISGRHVQSTVRTSHAQRNPSIPNSLGIPSNCRFATFLSQTYSFYCILPQLTACTLSLAVEPSQVGAPCLIFFKILASLVVSDLRQ